MLATRTFKVIRRPRPTTSPSTTREYVENNYNTIDTYGARAALRVNLGENWTITPTVMYQKQDQRGLLGRRPQQHAGRAASTRSRIRDGIHRRRVVRSRLSRSKARSATSTWCTPATTSTGRSTARSTTPTTAFWYDSRTRLFLALFLRQQRRPQLAVRQLHQRRRLYEAEPRVAHQLAADKRVRGMLGFF